MVTELLNLKLLGAWSAAIGWVSKFVASAMFDRIEFFISCLNMLCLRFIESEQLLPIMTIMTLINSLFYFCRKWLKVGNKKLLLLGEKQKVFPFVRRVIVENEVKQRIGIISTVSNI